MANAEETGRGTGDDLASEPAREYRLAVAVGDPDHVEQLMRTAVDVAANRNGEVLVLSVVTKPHDSPVALFADDVIARQFGDRRREILDRAVATAEGTGVPVRGRLLVGHDVARAIRTALDDYECDGVLLGWRERRREVVFGSNVDRVVTRASCDVLVERVGPTADGVGRVLLAAGEGPHASLAASVADAVALGNDAAVDVVRVVGPDADERVHEDAERLVAETAASLEAPADTHVTTAADATDALVAAADERDVAVLGATERGWLSRLVVGGTAYDVGRRAETTVVLARRQGGVPSRLVRWLRGLLR